MKKELCTLSRSDIQDYISLLSNYSTFQTLLKIDKINIDPQNVEDIRNAIISIDKDIKQYVNNLLLKYKVPYYVSSPMHIDIHNGVIYINE